MRDEWKYHLIIRTNWKFNAIDLLHTYIQCVLYSLNILYLSRLLSTYFVLYFFYPRSSKQIIRAYCTMDVYRFNSNCIHIWSVKSESAQQKVMGRSEFLSEAAKRYIGWFYNVWKPILAIKFIFAIRCAPSFLEYRLKYTITIDGKYFPQESRGAKWMVKINYVAKIGYTISYGNIAR